MFKKYVIVGFLLLAPYIFSFTTEAIAHPPNPNVYVARWRLERYVTITQGWVYNSYHMMWQPYWQRQIQYRWVYK